MQEMNYKDVVREFEADKSATRENIFLQGKDTVHSNCAKLVPCFMGYICVVRLYKSTPPMIS